MDELVAAINALDGNINAASVQCNGRVGSGASPVQDLPSWGVSLEHDTLDAEELAKAMRSRKPHIFGRIQDDQWVLDLRTVNEPERELILESIKKGY